MFALLFLFVDLMILMFKITFWILKWTILIAIWTIPWLIRGTILMIRMAIPLVILPIAAIAATAEHVKHQRRTQAKRRLELAAAISGPPAVPVVLPAHVVPAAAFRVAQPDVIPAPTKQFSAALSHSATAIVETELSSNPDASGLQKQVLSVVGGNSHVPEVQIATQPSLTSGEQSSPASEDVPISERPPLASAESQPMFETVDEHNHASTAARPLILTQSVSSSPSSPDSNIAADGASLNLDIQLPADWVGDDRRTAGTPNTLALRARTFSFIALGLAIGASVMLVVGLMDQALISLAGISLLLPAPASGVMAVLAIVFGGIGLRRSRQQDLRLEAKIGLALGIVALCLPTMAFVTSAVLAGIGRQVG